MNSVLDEALSVADLFPFSLTRPARDIRLGILTLHEKCERAQGDKTITAAIVSLAAKLRHPWDLFSLNEQAMAIDFNLLTRDRTSQPIPPSVQTIRPDNIFLEEGAKLSHCMLNASTGPIYIGKNAEIMEGATIRGPFALCEGAVVKMGARIYGATTIGPYSTAGGEIKNSLIFGYSNKAHDGYLGDSVIGEWCNLGAGTSNSNLKNNVRPVRVWSPSQAAFIPAGFKCGLIMGDYSRSAINTSFNTGTMVGICCNVFDDGSHDGTQPAGATAGPSPRGLTPKFIPNFSWGFGAKYEFEKVIGDISNWKALKGQHITEPEILLIKSIYESA